MLTIRKYKNRKMYNSEAKEYVTLFDIELLLKDNRDVQIIDVETGLDITGSTLLQVLAANPMNAQNVKFLKDVIRLDTLR